MAHAAHDDGTAFGLDHLDRAVFRNHQLASSAWRALLAKPRRPILGPPLPAPPPPLRRRRCGASKAVHLGRAEVADERLLGLEGRLVHAGPHPLGLDGVDHVSALPAAGVERRRAAGVERAPDGGATASGSRLRGSDFSRPLRLGSGRWGDEQRPRYGCWGEA